MSALPSMNYRTVTDTSAIMDLFLTGTRRAATKSGSIPSAASGQPCRIIPAIFLAARYGRSSGKLV